MRVKSNNELSGTAALLQFFNVCVRWKNTNRPPPVAASVLSAPRYVSASRLVVGACAPHSAAAPVADVESALSALY